MGGEETKIPTKSPPHGGRWGGSETPKRPFFGSCGGGSATPHFFVWGGVKTPYGVFARRRRAKNFFMGTIPPLKKISRAFGARLPASRVPAGTASPCPAHQEWPKRGGGADKLNIIALRALEMMSFTIFGPWNSTKCPRPFARHHKSS